MGTGAVGLEDRDWFREDAKERRLRALRNGLRSSVPNPRGRNHLEQPISKRPATAIVVVIALAAVSPAIVSRIKDNGIMPMDGGGFPFAPDKTAKTPPVKEVYSPDDSGIAFPPTGLEIWHINQNWRAKTAPFSIDARSIGNRHLVARIYKWSDDTPVATIYLDDGDIHKTQLALGKYRLRTARGDNWHGDLKLFGPGTRVSETEVPLSFEENANGVMGKIVELRGRIDGNLPDRPVAIGKF